MKQRTIHSIHEAFRDDIGELVTRRPLPNDAFEQIDPFLMLNHHGPQTYPSHNRGLPFGPHPHRGFETVTFIVDGSLMHRDSGGHTSVIDAGGVQWMTAGRGLEHAEESPDDFRERGGPLDILQLWVNLPSKLKMTEPRYIGLQKQDIPAIAAGRGARVNLIAGDWEGATGPVPSLTGVTMMTVEIESGGAITLPAPASRNVFFYVVRGGVTAASREVDRFHLVHFNPDGDSVEVVAKERALLLFGHADPIREPVAAHGPFVMNTREEIIEAIRDYQMGRFSSLDR